MFHNWPNIHMYGIDLHIIYVNQKIFILFFFTFTVALLSVNRFMDIHANTTIRHTPFFAQTCISLLLPPRVPVGTVDVLTAALHPLTTGDSSSASCLTVTIGTLCGKETRDDVHVSTSYTILCTVFILLKRKI